MLPSTRFATAERALEAAPPIIRASGDAGGSVAPTRSSLSVRILSLAVVAAISGGVLLIPLVLGVLISYALGQSWRDSVPGDYHGRSRCRWCSRW
jgi:hypothetical protein